MNPEEAEALARAQATVRELTDRQPLQRIAEAITALAHDAGPAALAEYVSAVQDVTTTLLRVDGQITDVLDDRWDRSGADRRR